MFQSCLLLVLLVISTLAAPLDEGGERKGAVVGEGEGEGAGGRGGGGEMKPVVGEGGGGVATESPSPSPLTVAEKGAVKAAESEVEVEYDEDYEYEEELDEETPSPAHPPIPDNFPRFIATLSDGNLLCYSIEGFELFTYNLLSTPQLHVNSFLNVTRLPSGEWVRGGTDLGFLVKIKDGRVKSGVRVFKIKVDGAEKKAELAGFGQVDMQGGSVEFSVDKEGHSDIESGDADHEQFTVTMESPKVVVWAVCGDGMTYNVYVEESSGLWDTPTHGVIGQFLRPDVKINVESGQLHFGPDRDPIPVSPAPVWDSVQDKGYQDRQCWYPDDQDKANILEGQPYDYVTEHLLSHKHQFSQFDPKSPL